MIKSNLLYLRLWKDQEIKDLVKRLSGNKHHADTKWYKRDPVEYVTHIFFSHAAGKLFTTLLSFSHMDKINDIEVRKLKNQRHLEVLIAAIPPTTRFVSNEIDKENLMFKGIPTTYD